MNKASNMPTKKRKYEARFPTARIKKIMQTDEEIGKVAAAVPVIISRALEIFLQQLVTKTSNLTKAKRAKTMTTGHLKQCIESENQFDFLKDLVSNIADMPNQDEEDNTDGGEVKPKKPRKARAAGEKKKGKAKKVSKSSSSNESEEDEASDDEEEVMIANNTGGHVNNNKQTDTPNATSTITRPTLESALEPTMNNASTSLPLPGYQAPSSLPMMLQSNQHEDEEDYDEDD